MKTLTFNIICSLPFGIERGSQRDRLINCFQEMIEGMWSIPVHLPFTSYNRSLRASRSVQKMLTELVEEKRAKLECAGGDPKKDLITRLLSILNQENRQGMTEREIIDNTMLVMVAGMTLHRLYSLS